MILKYEGAKQHAPAGMNLQLSALTVMFSFPVTFVQANVVLVFSFTHNNVSNRGFSPSDSMMSIRDFTVAIDFILKVLRFCSAGPQSKTPKTDGKMHDKTISFETGIQWISSNSTVSIPHLPQCRLLMDEGKG